MSHELIPQRLLIQGYTSFKECQVFTFRPGSGLALIVGDNGAGKSSIWGALKWLLFGKSEKELPSSKIKNRDKDSPELKVRLEFVLNGVEAALERTVIPTNHLTYETEGHQQVINSIDEVFNLDATMYNLLIHVHSFGESFLRWGPSEKYSFLSRLHDLSRWDEYKEQANTKVKSLKEKIVDLENEIIKLTERKNGLSASIENLRSKEKEWLDTKSSRIDAANKELGRAQQEYDESLKQHTKVEEDSTLEAHNIEMESLLSQRKEVKEQISKVIKKLGDMETEFYKLRAQKQIDKETLEKFGDGICPLCKQSVTNHFHKEDIERAIEEKSNKMLEIKKNGDIEKNNKAILESNLSSLEQAIANIKSQQIHAESIIQSSKRHLDTLERTVKQRKSERDNLVKEVSPFKAIIAENIASYQECVTKIDSLNLSKSGHKNKLQLYEFWATTGFEDIGRESMRSVCGILTQQITQYAHHLGFDWNIVLEPEYEGSGHKPVKRMRIVIDDGEGHLIALETLSGGEYQKVNLAVTLALAAHIEQLSGIHWPFIAFDEPGQYMSEGSLNKLVSVLRQWAIQHSKMIYLIDHRGIIHEHSEAVISIRRGERGSEIISGMGQ